jgi:hypothetical protein
MEATGRGLVEHWEWAARKGVMNLNTARALKAACHQVISVLDEWEAVDVRALDVDQTFSRFVNLRGRDFKPDSLDTYRNRFRHAISLYLSYVEDPAGWKPRVRERSGDGIARRSVTSASIDQGRQTAHNGLDRANAIVYPFPLRQDFVARLSLPPDLTSAEVQRLAAYMSLLAIDSQK